MDTHLAHVADNAGFAAATASVLAGALGITPWHDAVAALPAGLLGAYLRAIATIGSAVLSAGHGWF